jgi:hypothetical protein
MSTIATPGVLPKYAQYWSDPNGGESLASTIPLTGSTFSEAPKMRMSMRPSQNVGMAKPM